MWKRWPNISRHARAYSTFFWVRLLLEIIWKLFWRFLLSSGWRCSMQGASSRWGHCCSKPRTVPASSRSLWTVRWWLQSRDACSWITSYCGSARKHTCYDDIDFGVLFSNFSCHGNKIHFLLHAAAVPQHCTLIRNRPHLSSPPSFFPSEQW